MQNGNVIYGQAKVSTKGQSVATQVAALQVAGTGKLLCEVASSAQTDRTQLHKAIVALNERAGPMQGCGSRFG